jgi:N-acetylmuramoyl-L-alanine amidase
MSTSLNHFWGRPNGCPFVFALLLLLCGTLFSQEPGREILVDTPAGPTVLPTWEQAGRRSFLLEDLLRLQTPVVYHQERYWRVSNSTHRLELFEDSRLIRLNGKLLLLDHAPRRNSGGLLVDLELLELLLESQIIQGKWNRQKDELALGKVPAGIWREALVGGELIRLRLGEIPVFESSLDAEQVSLTLPAGHFAENTFPAFKPLPEALFESAGFRQESDAARVNFKLRPEAEALEVVEVPALGEIQIVLRRRGAALLDESLQEVQQLVVMPAGNRRPLTHVVIDPGHGGKDPGAVSPWGRYEKDMVLAIGLELRKRLKKAIPGIKVTMTRDTDTFLSLSRRTQLANQAEGDLFVSLHINAAQDRRARGYEVYLLRPGKFESASRVALRENSVLDLEDHGAAMDGSDWIMASMAQSVYARDSHNLAVLMASELGDVGYKRRRQVVQAGFQVLIGASMPAVLVECGFITNENDHKMMRKPEGQAKIAQALCDAIVAYAAMMEP